MAESKFDFDPRTCLDNASEGRVFISIFLMPYSQARRRIFQRALFFMLRRLFL